MGKLCVFSHCTCHATHPFPLWDLASLSILLEAEGKSLLLCIRFLPLSSLLSVSFSPSYFLSFPSLCSLPAPSLSSFTSSSPLSFPYVLFISSSFPGSSPPSSSTLYPLLLSAPFSASHPLSLLSQLFSPLPLAVIPQNPRPTFCPPILCTQLRGMFYYPSIHFQ